MTISRNPPEYKDRNRKQKNSSNILSFKKLKPVISCEKCFVFLWTDTWPGGRNSLTQLSDDELPAKKKMDNWLILDQTFCYSFSRRLYIQPESVSVD